MNAKEKKELREKIMSSARKYKSRTRRRYYYVSAAASVLILITIGFYTYENSQSSINQLVEFSQAVDVEPTEEVQLVLDATQTLTIEKNTASISYTADGSGVKITDSLGIHQKITLNNTNVLNTVIVPFGKRSRVELGDGTKVWLNSGSKLIYPVAFSGKHRAVYLEGEAIFDVTHNLGQPFKVLSEDHTVEVLGTVFNVSNYPDEGSIRTILKSGRVKVSHPTDSFFKSQESTEILPGTMAIYNKTNPAIKTQTVDVETYFSWREGVLIFKNNSLKDIMKKLGRYYNVRIAFEELEMEEETFSGHLNLKDSVEEILEILQETSNFEYTLNENGTIQINNHENM